jgi:hypothetical protein
MSHSTLLFLAFLLKESFGTKQVVQIIYLYRMGYNNLKKCEAFIHSNEGQKNWNDVKIIAFDAPQATDIPYAQRLELLRKRRIIYYQHLFIFQISQQNIQYCQ